MTSTLTAIFSALRRDYPELETAMYPPAPELLIAHAEHVSGLHFPDALKRLYRLHDGETGNGGLFFGLPFLPLEESLSEWQAWQGTGIIGTPLYSVPAGHIQETAASSHYWPLSRDNAGNFIAVDLAPGPKGTPGQIISLGRDEPVRYVIATGIAPLLSFMLVQVRQHNYLIRQEPGEPRLFLLKHPANNHFLDTLPGLPLPFAEDPATPSALNLAARGIEDIRTLQHITGLKKLDLSDNALRSAAGLEKLPQLTHLLLDRTGLRDLSFLAHLPLLEELSIAGTDPEDLRPLIAHNGLRQLTLDVQVFRQIAGQLRPGIRIALSGNMGEEDRAALHAYVSRR
ncbi:SMI1/KNR4 family protein [Chitinophaga lutea]